MGVGGVWALALEASATSVTAQVNPARTRHPHLARGRLHFDAAPKGPKQVPEAMR
jgi:hypothetical protein